MSRADGTNSRATGKSPRQMATNPRARAERGTVQAAKDAHLARAVVARAAHVAWIRGETVAPRTSREAIIYLEANRLGHGPMPTTAPAPRSTPSAMALLRTEATIGYTVTAAALANAEARANTGAPAALGPLITDESALDALVGEGAEEPP